LVDHPDEFSVSLSLAQTLLTWAYSCYRRGELSKSVDIALEGILVAQGLVEGKEELSEAWKLIGDAVFLGSLVQVDGSRELLKIAAEILGISDADGSGMNDGDDLDDGEDAVEETETKTKLLERNVAAMEKMVNLTQGDRLAHSAAYFNLGLAKYRLLKSETEESTTSSIRPILECFKKAIQSEPRNFEYWNALGVVTARHFPSVSEQAFSRSLQINEKVLWFRTLLMIEFGCVDEPWNHVSHAR
jgi:superkiller protein 3